MNVLVVDDQQDVLESIDKSVQWKRLGISGVFLASSALQAKAVIRKNRVDLLLSDIEMPEEDGLSLLKWIREEKLEIECIFLTSHADFGYARKALELESCDYVLQPARATEIESALIRATEKIRRKQEVSDLQEAHSRMESRQEAVLEHIMRMVYQEDGKEDELLFTNIPEAFARQGAEAVFCPAEVFLPEETKTEKSRLMQMLKDALTNPERKIAPPFICSKLDENDFIILIYGEKGSLIHEEIRNALRRFNIIWQNKFGCGAAIYLGRLREKGVCREIHILAELRAEQPLALGIVEPDELHAYEGKEILSVLSVSAWTKWIQAGDGNVVLSEIEEYCRHIKTGKQREILAFKQIHYLFTKSFFTAVEQSGLNTRGLFDEDFTYERYMRAFSSGTELRSSLEKCVARYNELAGMSQENRLEKACQYIKDNISKNVSRAEVASYVYLNEEYFSRIFRKETGYTFKEYVMLEKMKYAKRLLATTSFSIGIIGSKVGYDNFSYFSKVFGKAEGMSPQEYRNLHQKK